MEALSYEIRICSACGLRYPLLNSQDFGRRCPACLGETSVVHTRALPDKINHRGNAGSGEIQLQVLLDNIRSGWNAGSILRTADGFGFKHAYLCGITPTPDQPAVQKTALGAENSVTWSKHPNAVLQSRELQSAGWQIFALENADDSIPIDTTISRLDSARILLVLGNEVCGVDPGILNLADKIVHLPMHGQKRSFNVAMAFAAASALIYNEIMNKPAGTQERGD
jgi:23S rRNA (guanosine2251-2'-O)-methyltransferase